MWREQAFGRVGLVCLRAMLGLAVLILGSAQPKAETDVGVVVSRLVSATETESGDDCIIGMGDVIRLLRQPTDDQSEVKVLTAHPGDCSAGAVVVVKSADLPPTTLASDANAPPLVEAAPPEIELWRSMMNSKNVADYRAYLEQFPSGAFAALAKARIGELAKVSASAAAPSTDAEMLFWQSVKDSTNPADFQAYLKQYPKGLFAALARNRIAASVPSKPVGAPHLAMATPPPKVAPVPAPAVGQSFRDCADCPEMVVVPAGQFMMGTDASEAMRKREDMPDNVAAEEAPRHPVSVRNAFAVGKYDVTRGEYARFVQATGYLGGSGCTDVGPGKGDPDAAKSWRDPGFPQTDRDPVVCVSWDDAKAYAAWLARTSGKFYRLLTEAEWEYAARGGTDTARYWGDAIGRGNANCGGCGSQWDNKSTSPVGSFSANPFGLYDMLGNAQEWTADCRTIDFRNGHPNYASAPNDSSIALTEDDCIARVVRGGAWGVNWRNVRVGYRDFANDPARHSDRGFRVARTL